MKSRILMFFVAGLLSLTACSSTDSSVIEDIESPGSQIEMSEGGVEEVITRDTFETDVSLKKEALEKRDVSLCEKIDNQSSRQGCFAALAYETEDISLCDKIELEFRNRENCYSTLAMKLKDISMCDDAQWGQNQNCRINVAYQLKDSSLCDDLLEDIEAYSYKDLCYGDIAGESLDGKICAKIQDVTNKDRCFRNIASQNDDVSACDELSKNQGPCRKEIAIRLKDLDVCETINTHPWRDDCFAYFAGINMDLSLCSKIDGVTNLESLNGCYAGVAINTGDLSICNKIEGDEYKSILINNCMFNTATNRDDYEGCVSDVFTGDKEKCVDEIYDKLIQPCDGYMGFEDVDNCKASVLPKPVL